MKALSAMINVYLFFCMKYHKERFNLQFNNVSWIKKGKYFLLQVLNDGDLNKKREFNWL